MDFERLWHKSYAPGIPAEIDIEEITLPEILTRSTGRFPDNIALIYMGKKITYRELEGLVNRFARALMGLGVKAGDKVAMLLPNVPQMVIASYATYRIGAVTVMNNPLYTERELEYQLNDSDSTVLVTLDLLFPRALKLRENTRIERIITCHINDYLPFPKKQLVPILKKDMHRKIEPTDGVHEFMDLMKDYSGEPVENVAKWEELGTLMYTGGTTGVSKGVMLTHANISSNTQQLRVWFSDLEDGKDSELAVFPFFHSAGYTGVMNLTIYSGNTDILVPRPEPGVIIEMIEKFKPSLVPGVPTIFVGLLNSEKFRNLDFSCVKAFAAGAAPLAVDTIKQIKSLANVPIVNVYGLTEIAPMGTATPWGGEEKVGTVGVPLPNTDLKIVDLETGENEMAQGETGEVLFKGPQVMKGYYKKPEETAKALKDGWVSTGDIGFLDEDGYLTIVDRKKDMIVASGYNIYPNEVDEVLFEHPRILEACTIGVPDEYRGESVKTYIVVKPGEKLTKEDVIGHCKAKLAAYKVPREIEFIDELPKTAVGKILRRELKKLDREKREGSA
jgi:long-chain acyl-CoA synthetase